MSSEYKTFCSKFSELVTGTANSISEIADKCLDSKLIAQETHEKVLQLNNTSKDKARLVLTNIRDTIKYFYKFVTILEEVSCEDLARSLKPHGLQPQIDSEQLHVIPQPVHQKPEREGPPHHTTNYINIFSTCIAVLGLGIIIAAGWNWYTNSQPPHTDETYKSECLRKDPTMPCLLKFPGVDHVINIPEMIGAHYNSFGMLLLQDKPGSLMLSIEKELQRDSVEINNRILRMWLEGRGKPVKWETLVEVLRDIKLKRLAQEINATLNT